MSSSENSITTAQKKPSSKWPILLFGAVVIGLLCFAFLKVLFREPAGSETDNTPDFDPSPFAELEIKGVLPQGESSWIALEVPPPPTTPVADQISKGRTLFNKACAGCHGSGGNGDGPLAKKTELSSLPADLTQPLRSIKIRTTLSGRTPMPEDLFRTITRGFPGTAMQSFRTLSAEDRWALVFFVQSLSSDYEKFAGVPLKIPAKIPATPEVLAAGRAVFERFCINCHGEKGLGTASGLYDQNTGKLWAGVRWARKAGRSRMSGFSEDDIARTVMTGLHQRSPMLSFQSFFYAEANPNAEAKAAMDRRFWGTVWYVKQLDQEASK